MKGLPEQPHITRTKRIKNRPEPDAADRARKLLETWDCWRIDRDTNVRDTASFAGNLAKCLRELLALYESRK